MTWKIAGLWALAVGSFLLQPSTVAQDTPPRLQVSDNGRYLVTEEGRPIFLLGDTAWRIASNIERSEVVEYLDMRRAQYFNTVAMVAVWDNSPNAYGERPFQTHDEKPDPTQPKLTSTSDSDDGQAYGYWDHLDFCIDEAGARGMYVVLLPAWGELVAGSWSGEDTSNVIFDAGSAYEYGRWIGARYAERPHILWMMSGDRSPVYVKLDYRPVFRAMAEGVADGLVGEDRHNGVADYTRTLMSYHPRKEQPNSSHWFHHDPWLSFNSIQDWPEAQLAAVWEDLSRAPARPTWLFEGRYEGFHRGGYEPEDWSDWQIRFQAYQIVFAGAFGHVYGHETVFRYGSGWRSRLQSPGALDMQHVYALMTAWDDVSYLNRIPDQDLIEGDPGVTQRLSSDRLQATRSGGEYAMIYSANGRDIRIRMERLDGPAADAYWYDPRTGQWHVDGTASDERRPFISGVPSGPGALSYSFDPPGEPEPENDWVLVLERAR
jgi:hypothetical protein